MAFRFSVCALALALVAPNSAVANDALTGRVLKYTAPDGKTYSAVGIRAARINSTQVGVAQDHVILVDTSASQAGDFRKQSFAVLQAYLKALPKNDRVAIFAVDSQIVDLTNGFAPTNGTAVDGAIKKLNARTPLGATNLSAAAAKALETIEKNRRSSILYIGDGMSTARIIQSKELTKLTDSLRQRQVTFNSFAVGPRTDNQLLGVLAMRTGGVVRLDRVNKDAKKSIAPEFHGSELAKAASRPVLYPTSEITANGLNLLPKAGLPLRMDRDTIFLATGKVQKAVKLSAKGLAGEAKIEGQGDSYLRALWTGAEQSSGLTVHLAGRNLLTEAQDAFNVQIERMASFGERAVGFRKLDQADRIAESLNELDPGNVRAKAIRESVKKIRKKEDGLVFAKVQPAAQPGAQPKKDDGLPPSKLLQPNPPDKLPAKGGDPKILPGLGGQTKSDLEQITFLVNSRINFARNTVERDPDTAINEIKSVIGRISDLTGIPPNVRRDLLRRLVVTLEDLEGRRRVIEQKRQQMAVKRATLEAQRRLITEMQLEEQQIERLIDQVRALIESGVHGDDDAYQKAEVVSEALVDLRPGSGVSAAALFTSEAAGQLNLAFRMRSLRADRFLAVLEQVELSHVPFPDEPPIRWPSAEVWKALTERRKKWASVDLHKQSPAEVRIESALQDRTKLEFVDITLNRALEYISDLHGITIMPDKTAWDEAQITGEEPVTLKVDGITLRSALRLLLQPLELTYVIEDEVMKITTTQAAEDLARYGSTRVYPVGDLVVPINSGGVGGIGGGLGGFGNPLGGGFGGGGQFGGGGFGGGGFGGGGFGGGGFGGGGFPGGGFGGGGFFNVPPAIPADLKKKQ